jgi:hypothetical protein
MTGCIASVAQGAIIDGRVHVLRARSQCRFGLHGSEEHQLRLRGQHSAQVAQPDRSAARGEGSGRAASGVAGSCVGRRSVLGGSEVGGGLSGFELDTLGERGG